MSIAFVSIGVWGVRALARNRNMAGRYQGYHSLPNNNGTIEIFWRADGWWWSRRPGYPAEGAPIGPFLTSTDAYLNARGGAPLIPAPQRLYRQGSATT
jgi:hypothetical protein